MNDLQDTVFSLPVVDTHAHVRQYDAMPQPMSAAALFNASGNLRQWWVSSGALSRAEHRQMKQFEDWDQLSRAIDTIKATAFYRIFTAGLRSLYSIDFDELDQRAFGELSDRIERAYADPGWYRTVIKEKSGVAVTCQDSRGEMDRTLFTPVARFDGYVWFGRAQWRASVVNKHGPDKTSSLRGLIECLEADFDEAVQGGACAIKNNSTWCRRLDFADVSESEAERALADVLAAEHSQSSLVEKAGGGADIDPFDILGSFIMNRICELCAHYDIPLQLHTGPAGGTDHWIDYGNPLHLNGLMLRHPNTKFVLFHAGGPWSNECRELAVQFPNCYLDMCGVMAVEGIRTILDDWIERVPHTKIMWGTDANTAEEVYALVCSFRTVVARFLSQRVDSGYLTAASAVQVARALLSENAGRILRL